MTTASLLSRSVLRLRYTMYSMCLCNDDCLHVFARGLSIAALYVVTVIFVRTSFTQTRNCAKNDPGEERS